jgi:hypothetical protein
MKRDDKKTILKSSAAKTCLGFLLLAVGCLIYLLFRSRTLYIYVWCKFLGLSAFIDTLRYAVHDWQLSDFIRYSLPDGLYVTAYILMMDAIWHDDKRMIKYVILSIVPFITIASEILQYLGLVPGTFDAVDLICYAIPPLIYSIIIITKQFKSNIFKHSSIMKKYLYSVLVMALFAIGFAASDEKGEINNESTSPASQTEQTVETVEPEPQNIPEQAPPKSKEDEIRELGFNDGVKFGYSDKGDALRSYVQMGQTLENGLSHIQHVVAKVAYKEDYGDDISDELLDEYCEQFIEGYKSVVIKE